MIERMIDEDSKSLFKEKKFKLTRLELRNKVHLSV